VKIQKECKGVKCYAYWYEYVVSINFLMMLLVHYFVYNIHLSSIAYHRFKLPCFHHAEATGDGQRSSSVFFRVVCYSFFCRALSCSYFNA